MGQAITVTVRAGVRSDVKHFELNRSLTGMQTHRYTEAVPVTGTKPPDELARRLFAHGGVEGVHIYSNVVTLDLAKGASSAGLADIIGSLFVHYDHDEQAQDAQEGVTAAPS